MKQLHLNSTEKDRDIENSNASIAPITAFPRKHRQQEKVCLSHLCHLPFIWHLPRSQKLVTSIRNQGRNLVTQPWKYQFNTQVNQLTSVCPSDYESITKALMYGPPERTAKAVVKCKLLTKCMLQNVLRLLSSGVCGLCSKSNTSLLRKCDKDTLIKLDFQSLCEEWKDRAPIFYSFLITCLLQVRCF